MVPLAVTDEEAVFVMDTSAIAGIAGVILVTTTLLVLLVGSGSVTPGGVATVAVLLSVPDAGAVPTIVIVTEPPLGMPGTAPDTVLDWTRGSPQTAPPAGLLHDAVTPVKPAGNTSEYVVPLAGPGPLLLTIKV
jgi:hypothetical protein